MGSLPPQQRVEDCAPYPKNFRVHPHAHLLIFSSMTARHNPVSGWPDDPPCGRYDLNADHSYTTAPQQ